MRKIVAAQMRLELVRSETFKRGGISATYGPAGG